MTDINVNASSLLASAGGPRPAGDVEALCERLESFALAYPNPPFGPVTEQEVRDHASLITRNSAAMGRHMSRFTSEAAAMIREQRDEIARLTDANADCPPCVSPGSCRANGKCLNAAAKIQQLAQRVERAEAELADLREWNAGNERRDAEYVAMRAERDAANALAEHMRAILRDIQWNWQGYCPLCAGWCADPADPKRGDTPKVHTKTCLLAAALAQRKESKL